jgi:hypothetical protein
MHATDIEQTTIFKIRRNICDTPPWIDTILELVSRQTARSGI